MVPHKDSIFLQTNSNSLVGIWIAMDDAETINGCMWGIPDANREKSSLRFIRKND